jgi:hypothetical protein
LAGLVSGGGEHCFDDGGISGYENGRKTGGVKIAIMFTSAGFFFGAAIKAFKNCDRIFVIPAMREWQSRPAAGEEGDAAGKTIASEGVYTFHLLKEAARPV